MTRPLRWWIECETWNTHDTGSSKRLYRRWWLTRAEAEKEHPRLRAQLQRDFGSRFIDSRLVQR